MDQDRTYTFLLLEDDESDVFLMKRQLERHLERVDLKVASTQEGYEELVRTAKPDVILSDYRLPRYSGIEALLYARAHTPMVPFIFVTGALHNEELAADTILQGASGFVLKNNLDKLWKLLPAVLERGGLDGVVTAHSTAESTESHAEVAGLAHSAIASEVATRPASDSRQIVAKLAEADAETLAKIERLLSGQAE